MRTVAAEVARIRSGNDTEASRIIVGEHGEKLVLEKIRAGLQVGPIIVQDYLFEANDMECQVDLLLIFQNECV